MRSFCIMSMIFICKNVCFALRHKSLASDQLGCCQKRNSRHCFQMSNYFVGFCSFFFFLFCFHFLFISSNKNSNESKAVFQFFFLFYAFLTPAAAHYRTSLWFIIMLFYMHTPQYFIHIWFDRICRFLVHTVDFHFSFPLFLSSHFFVSSNFFAWL